MVKTKQLTEYQRIEIIRLKGEGMTQTEIATKLGCDQCTVSRTIKRYNEHKTVKDLARSGRKRLSTDRDQRQLIRLVKDNRTLSSTELSKRWTLTNGKTASPRLVRKILQDHDLMWRPAAKKPRLTANNIKQRLEFCKKHKTWSKYRWRDVIFSDEMNVEVDLRKNRIMLRRTTEEKYSPECIIERTRKGSGSVGIWACMTYDGVKFFTLFHGRLNAERYEDILENNLVPTLDLIGEKEHSIFQQDNAPCHSANRIKDWMATNKVNQLQWPANSPDLNCIENLWSWLDGQLAKRKIASLDELKGAITDILNNVPQNVTQKLVDSMPTRIKACLEAQGRATKY